ncbi:hypothetical protein Ddye_012692 [Dipteronia dyeriana]|uniref:Jacalin-type lectin domain-containing protein n=1 Tax=Dipteronia dyeriana TaxID=168575 RepID=A0AAD9X517_9ROSI|nr:hypothetical protein Ddye_012692 [Dipteronia dyeriana]
MTKKKKRVYQSSIEVGPWGGLGGTRWSYMPKGGIKEIIINHGVIIESLSFRSVCANKESESSSKFGGEGGKSTLQMKKGRNKTQISIDWPEEYLTSISGTVKNNNAESYNNTESVVESLTFYTNWRTHGPFGSEKGTHFSLPFENRVILGFHGRAKEYMDAIGVYQKAATSIQGQFMTHKVYQSSIGVGPWGGIGGTIWSYMPEGGIVEIIINHGVIIDSLSFKSVGANNEAESSSTFGGKGGSKTQIPIDWPKEYLTSISGTTMKYNNTELIESLTFYTNRRTHGPFGYEKGTHFSLPIENRVIVGFHGRAGLYMDAIGIYQTAATLIQGQFMTPKVTPKSVYANNVAESSSNFGGKGGNKTQVYQSSIEVGPWGGIGGTIWSYMPEGGIVEIIINHGVIIDSLSFKSVCANNEAESSSTFGGKGGSKTQIPIDWPKEYLMSISGSTMKYNNTELIESLTFYTNRRTHGPFGYEKGTHFSLPIENRVIVGFHGRAGLYVDAIGVYQTATTLIQGQFMTPKEGTSQSGGRDYLSSTSHDT